ncbi:MAG: type 4a pilus biogenesis protein PilO [Limnobacter sp.]|uniref:type 4a pilus biogenesis protein PilO n=1 Tax=Limnobacter sp. TaxID=2003368 RepID=UPI0032EEE50D
MRLDELDFRTFVEDLPLLSVFNRICIVLGMWFFLAIVCFLMFWKNSLETSFRLEAEIQDSLTRLDVQSLLLLEAPEIEQRLAQLEAQLPILTAALPTERELASLLGKINEMILGQELNLSEFTPQESVDKEVMRVVPVKIRVRGQGVAIAKLSNQIVGLSRQVSLKEFEMSVLPDSGGWQMNGELNAFAQLSANASNPQSVESGESGESGEESSK